MKIRKWFSSLISNHILVIGVAAFILVLILFRNGDIIGTAESELPFYNLDIFTSDASWSWSNAYLGTSTGLTTALFPTWWVLLQIQNIGAPGFVTQAVFFWLIFFSAGNGIYFLTKTLFPEMPSHFLLFAVFFYWFNPLSYINVWNRFLYNFMVFWAFLPLGTYFFIRGLQKQKYIYAIIFAISTLIFSYAFSSIIFTLLLWFWVSYIALFFIILRKQSRKFIILYVLLSAVMFVLLNAWWISQYISFIFSKSLGFSINLFFSIQGNLVTLRILSEKLGQLFYALRFLPGNAWDDRFGQTLITSGNPFGILQFLFPGVIFWMLYKYRKTFEVLLVCSLFLLSLFLIKGNNEPFGEIFQFLFLKFTPIQVFRDPFEKFSFFLIPSATLALVFGFWKISTCIKGLRLSKTIYYLLLSSILIIWGFPFLTGRVFSRVDIKAKTMTSYEVKVPEYYKEVNKWFNDQPNDFRFLSLPLGGEGMAYLWEKPYLGVELSRDLFSRSNISFNTTMPFYNGLVSNLSTYQLDEKLLSFLPFLNSKYILLRSDIDFKSIKVTDPSSIKQKLETWVNKGILSKKFEKGKLFVYEINDNLVWPKIFITPNILISNQTDLNEVMEIRPQFAKDTVAVINYDDFSKQQDQMLTNNFIVIPGKVFIPNLKPLDKRLTEKELIDKLFYSRHLPTEHIYPLIRLKELLESPPKEDYYSWIFYQVGILGKRAVEIHDLYEASVDKEAISKAENDYLQNLAKIRPYVSDANQESLESLLFQLLLLKKTPSVKLQETLTDVLAENGAIYRYDLPPIDNTTFIIYQFLIHKAGNYSLSLNRKLEPSEWFVNGKRLGGLLSPDNLLYLEAGENEFAMQAKEVAYKTDALSIDDMMITDKLRYTKQFSFPDTPGTYKINFDYRFEEGNVFDLNITQNIDNPDYPFYSKQIVKDPLFHGWNKTELTFKSSAGAETAILEFVSEKVKSCHQAYFFIKSCADKTSEFGVEIKNFTIKRVDFPQITLSLNRNLESRPTTTTWSWVEINPSMYALKIDKKTSDREAVVFSELYDQGWNLYRVENNDIWQKAKLQSQWAGVAAEYIIGSNIHVPQFPGGLKHVYENSHSLTNVYANSWIIDQPGKYEFVLMFTPQRNYYLGILISVGSLLGIIFYFGIKVLWIKK